MSFKLMKIKSLNQSDSKEISNIAKTLRGWFTPSGRRNIMRACKTQKGFVAYDEKIVGFILYRKWKSMAEITWMGILPNYQNKGIGTKLIKSVEDELKANAINKIKVATLSPTTKYKLYEKTRKFYRKIGFKKYRIDKKFYPDGSDRLVFLKEI